MKNMIIWINGANGVGKSKIAEKLAEYLTNYNAEYIETDMYWEDFLKDWGKIVSKMRYIQIN